MKLSSQHLGSKENNDELLTSRSAFKGSKKKLSQHIRNKIFKTRYIFNNSPNIINQNYYQNANQDNIDENKIQCRNISRFNYYNKTMSLRSKQKIILSYDRCKSHSRTNHIDLIVQNSKNTKSQNKQQNKKIQFHSQNLKDKMNIYLNYVINQSLQNQKAIAAQFQQSLALNNKILSQRSTVTQNKNSFFRKMKIWQQKKQHYEKINLEDIDDQIIQRAKQIQTQRSKRNKHLKIMNTDIQMSPQLKLFLKTVPNTILE